MNSLMSAFLRSALMAGEDGDELSGLVREAAAGGGSSARATALPGSARGDPGSNSMQAGASTGVGAGAGAGANGSGSSSSSSSSSSAPGTGDRAGDEEGDQSGARGLLELLGSLSASVQGLGIGEEGDRDWNEDDANAPLEVVTIASACKEGDYESLKEEIDRITEAQGSSAVISYINNANRTRRTPLMIAASTPCEGSKECVELLMQNDANPVMKDLAGNTALHLALEANNIPVAQLLFEKGCDVSSSNRKGQLPTHLAARGGHEEALQLLKSKDVNFDTADDDGETPLHLACMFHHHDVVKFLLDSGANCNSTNKMGFTPIFLAVMNEHDNVDLISLLVDHGADLKICDRNKRTPLHVACAKNEATAKFLVEKGAKCDVQDGQGFTPLHVCCLEGFSSVVSEMLKKKSGKRAVRIRDNQNRSVLLFACNRGRAECARLLIEAGADVNEADEKNVTPLIHAATNGFPECITVLTDFGADIDARERVNGLNALLVAVGQNEKEAVLALLKAGAEPETPSSNYFHNAFHVASIKGHASMVHTFAKWVLKFKGRGVLKRMILRGDTDGDTPLHLATERKHEDVVNNLLEYGARPEMTNGSGFTALHLAARQGAVGIVKLLLQKNITRIIHLPKGDGYQALHLACLNGFDEIAKVLLEKGANINAITNDRQTALMLSCRRNHKNVIDVLLENKADMEMKDKDGETAVIFALRSKEENVEVLNTLIDAGADLSTRANDQECVLHYAARAKRPISMKILLERIDPSLLNAAGNTGWTTLHIVAKTGQTAVVELLLDYGADPNPVKSDHYTPLHLAALNGHMEAVKMLLAFGADLTMTNDSRQTPQDVAQNERNQEIATLLEESLLHPPERRYPTKTAEHAQQQRRNGSVSEGPRRPSILGRMFNGRGSRSDSRSDDTSVSRMQGEGTSGSNSDAGAGVSAGSGRRDSRSGSVSRRGSITRSGSVAHHRGPMTLGKLLDEIGFGRYAPMFEEHGFERPDTWQHLTKDELVSWGVKRGHALVITKRITDYLAERQAAEAAAPSSSSSSSTAVATTTQAQQVGAEGEPGAGAGAGAGTGASSGQENASTASTAGATGATGRRGSVRARRSSTTTDFELQQQDGADSSRRRVNRTSSLRPRKKSHAAYVISSDPTGDSKFASKLSELLQDANMGGVLNQETSEDWNADINDSYAIILVVSEEFKDAVDNMFDSEAHKQFMMIVNLDARMIVPVVKEKTMASESTWGTGLFGTFMRYKFRANIVNESKPSRIVMGVIEKIKQAREEIESSDVDGSEIWDF